MLNKDFGASRRSVLKGAAWTAPVVVLATAAPAFAVSGAAALTTVVENANNESRDGVDVLLITTRVTNANTGAPGVTTVVFTVAPTPGGAIVDANPTVLNVGAGFVYASRQPLTGGGFTYTFTNSTFVGASSASTSEVKVFSFTVPVTGVSAGAIEVTTTPTNGTSAPGVGRAWT